MPSILLDGPDIISGGINILSGNVFSGQGAFHPVGDVRVKAGPANSGVLYVGLSGGLTLRSGGFFRSGASGGCDGWPLKASESYTISKLAFIPNSGSPKVFVTTDALGSGRDIVYWEVY